ncbi:GntR family transcriptional regulator [Micromonospora gifhornensis]|uniref:GntR family transcriptional regulator n=1 Tax=Micromonospora gifhornensis TaxID=84594 RepID=A0ABQ4I8U3_9ACTN|nr:GntR family transcriptional regulator [Micromonospora gifhornensis]GIJ14238.1 GntR family transcriptional regulator [Micromonospora gifhornensis]
MGDATTTPGAGAPASGGRPPARYRQIAADLASRIHQGEYAPGEALPAQRELSAHYGVTLMTLRQALQQLSDEGLIVQQAGRGTYVTPVQAAYRVDTLRSFTEDLREQGHDVVTQVLSSGMRRPPAWVADRLGGADGERTLRLERLRLLNGRPAIHQVSWVRSPHGTAIRERDFVTTSLYAALADCGVAILSASERIVPGVLSAPVAGHLRQPVGSPVFVSERTTVALDGTAVVVDRAVIVGNAMEIRAERAATRLSVRWGAVHSPAASGGERQAPQAPVR